MGYMHPGYPPSSTHTPVPIMALLWVPGYQSSTQREREREREREIASISASRLPESVHAYPSADQGLDMAVSLMHLDYPSSLHTPMSTTLTWSAVDAWNYMYVI